MGGLCTGRGKDGLRQGFPWWWRHQARRLTAPRFAASGLDPATTTEKGLPCPQCQEPPHPIPEGMLMVYRQDEAQHLYRRNWHWLLVERILQSGLENRVLFVACY